MYIRVCIAHTPTGLLQFKRLTNLIKRLVVTEKGGVGCIVVMAKLNH